MKDFQFTMNIEQAEAMLMSDAAMVGAMNENSYCENDMQIDINAIKEMAEYAAKDFNEIGVECPTTRYLALRKCGVEGGTQQHVKERCAVLGQPVVIYKVTVYSDKVEIKKRVA